MMPSCSDLKNEGKELSRLINCSVLTTADDASGASFSKFVVPKRQNLFQEDYSVDTGSQHLISSQLHSCNMQGDHYSNLTTTQLNDEEAAIG